MMLISNLTSWDTFYHYLHFQMAKWVIMGIKQCTQGCVPRRMQSWPVSPSDLRAHTLQKSLETVGWCWVLQSCMFCLLLWRFFKSWKCVESFWILEYKYVSWFYIRNKLTLLRWFQYIVLHVKNTILVAKLLTTMCDGLRCLWLII